MDYSQLTDEELLLEAKQLLEEVANRVEQRAPQTANPDLNPYYIHNTGKPKEVTGLSLVYRFLLMPWSTLNEGIEDLKQYMLDLEIIRADIESTLGCDFNGFTPPKEDANGEHWFRYSMALVSESAAYCVLPPRTPLIDFRHSWQRYLARAEKSFGESYIQPHAPAQIKEQRDAANKKRKVSLVNQVIFYLNKIEGLPIVNTENGTIFICASEILSSSHSTVWKHYYQYQTPQERHASKRVFDFLLHNGVFDTPKGIERISEEAKKLFSNPKNKKNL